MKQSELAKKIGISQSMLHYILNGKRGIGPKTAEKLSGVSNKTAWWWIKSELGKVFTELDKIKAGVRKSRCARTRR